VWGIRLTFLANDGMMTINPQEAKESPQSPVSKAAKNQNIAQTDKFEASFHLLHFIPHAKG
jgi:hypothetical protein